VAERLYLVRHAEVIPSMDRQAADWPLSHAGHRSARDLAAAREWRSVGLVASSPEEKARDTAQPIAEAAGLSLRTKADLREVERGATPIVSQEEYFALVAAHFASPDEPISGWETGAAARERVTACIERLAAEENGALCVVSHALLLSHYLADLRGLTHPDVHEWRAITHPAVAVVDLAARRPLTGFLPAGQFMSWGEV
jgi:2,3-bisphosphoglycerate-dependent phosphoglycerate mutase